jgi:hypothetical protein
MRIEMRLRRSSMRTPKTVAELTIKELHLGICMNVPPYSPNTKGAIEKCFSKLDSEFLQQIFDKDIAPDDELSSTPKN